MADFNMFTLPLVRLSYPHLFKKSSFQGNVGKYRAQFMIPKSDTETLKTVEKMIKDVISSSGVKVPKDKLCLKDGDDYDRNPEYSGHYIFTASSDHKPIVLDPDGDDITEMMDKVYPGCWVKATVGIWLQNNNYGKRVNGNLYGVQFVKDDEKFSSINEDAVREQLTGKQSSSVDDSIL